MSSIFMFNPLTKNDQQILSCQCHLSRKRFLLYEKINIPLTEPSNIIPIGKDGNCFYRCCSYYITGCQEEHYSLRQHVINYLLSLPKSKYESLLPSGESMHSYIHNRKPSPFCLGTWANEVEIYGMAMYLGKSIYIYTMYGTNWKWVKYCWTCTISYSVDRIDDTGIYLKHTNGNHFEVVTAVTYMQNSTNVSLNECNSSKRKNDKNDMCNPVHPIKKSRLHSLQDCDVLEENLQQLSNPTNGNYMFDNIKLCTAINECATNPSITMKKNSTVCNVDNTDVIMIDDLKRNVESLCSESTLNTGVCEKLNDIRTLNITESTLNKNINNFTIKKKNNDHLIGKNYMTYIVDHNYAAKLKNEENTDINVAIKKFQNECKHVPGYVCTVCHRLLFREQVVKCNKTMFDHSVQFSITGKYVHTCNDTCGYLCDNNMICPRQQEWICICCKSYLKLKKIPAEAVVNKMELKNIPSELMHLNTLESQLICKRIAFMKIAVLPKGKQKGIAGPVICVPSNINKTQNSLPRMASEAQLVKVKLKRKLVYKGHYLYREISPLKIDKSLQYLIDNNELYKDVEIDQNWMSFWQKDGELFLGANEEINSQSEHESPISCENESKESEQFEEEDLENRLRGMPFDSCLQPIDIGQEFLDYYDENIICIAPAENNSPLSMFKDMSSEEMCFPVQFPTGEFGFNVLRDIPITTSRYFKTRLMGADNRFAKDTSYIFFAQYVTELKDIENKISISLRKGTPFTSDGRKISAHMLSSKDDLKSILKSDDGYRFLAPVRGTPQYWEKTLLELFAMIRQLGIPTWFATFSSADLRWPEILDAIEIGDGKRLRDNLSWEEKCEILRKNPVTAARMFDKRLKLFYKHVLLSSAHPIGEIIDYFHRIEFQMRGSPHAHCLFWVKNAPKIGVNSDEEICAFVDKYVCGQIPDKDIDLDLYEKVNDVHTHRKGHTKSCKKGGKICRYGFPRPPVKNTFICHSKNVTHADSHKSDNQNEANMILKKFWDIMDNYKDLENVTTDDILTKVEITSKQFCEAYRSVASRSEIVLKRRPKDVWVNNYNPHLLKAWNGNTDLQYVIDPYSCVKYIVSYISKAERELGNILKQAQKEAREGNNDIVQEMRKIGRTYLHCREISAQEAVFRVCSLRLKSCSRDVIFIPTDMSSYRMSKPLVEIQKIAQNSNNDVDNIWLPNIMDRYKARPRIKLFEKMCAAVFVSHYRIVKYSNEECNMSNEAEYGMKYNLQYNLGMIQKRSKSKPAIIRFPKFNKVQHSEKYYFALLKLYLPHYNDEELKPDMYNTYENFYLNGSILGMSQRIESVKKIVDVHRMEFEEYVEDIDRAIKDVGENDMELDAWAQIFPNVECDRLQTRNIPKEFLTNVDVQEKEIAIPDLAPSCSKTKMEFTLESCPRQMNPKSALSMLQSLNSLQKDVFYFVRKWCIEKVQGRNPDAFHIFVTGGAGSGKSLLIQSIHFEASKILRQCQENPNNTSVLLTAPTGTAAFNISGCTIHHALHINQLPVPYKGLTENILNKIRCYYEDLKILIVDEISMVDNKMLMYIDSRLRQLTQNDIPFGNISILAVGDMYQIPPVKGQSLYKNRQTNFSVLWNELFHVIELEEIMRQKTDMPFASMLNRLRVKNKYSLLSDEDKKMLLSRTISIDFSSNEYPKDCLHIFSKNSFVKDHNEKMLNLKCPSVSNYEAYDYEKNSITGNILKCCVKSDHKDDLPKTVRVGIGARVMLCRNICVQSGLVNGAFGTVTGVSKMSEMKDSTDVNFRNNIPKRDVVYVLFDDPKVGSFEKSQEVLPQNVSPGSIAIYRYEDLLKSNKKITRYQIPLKLAYAATIHKVQGMTKDKAVISMKGIFAAGMSYVGLSRVKNLTGLHILNFNEKLIYCDNEIKDAINAMKKFSFQYNPFLKMTRKIKIVHHNIEGLISHFDSLKATCLIDADIICLTETWLSEKTGSTRVLLEKFSIYRVDRIFMYNTASSATNYGGVCMYVRNDYNCKICTTFSKENIECLILQLCIKFKNIVIMNVYRPPHVQKRIFLRYLTEWLEYISDMETDMSIIVGDFNENILSSSENKDIFHYITSKGYNQIINSFTTRKETLLDHIYVSSNINCFNYGVIQTFYSYHDATYCMIDE